MNTNDSAPTPSPSRPVLIEKELSHEIVGCFFDVYNELGYGLMESLYARALEIELRGRGVRVDREYPVVVRFRGEPIGYQRVDMLVEERIVVELKSVERLPATARRQLRSYISALKLDLGILLHFGPRPNFYREVRARQNHLSRRTE